MMVQLTRKNFDNIRPLIDERIDQCGLDGRMTTDHAINLLVLGGAAGEMVAFVDKEDDPSCVLIVSVGTIGIFTERVCLINLLYVAEKVRKENSRASLQFGIEMMEQAEVHAKAKKADIIKTSSWTWKGAEGVGVLYESKGFEIQNTDYIKTL